MGKFFINRPIVAFVIAIITVIVGLVALLGLPIAQYPDIVPPEIFINTFYTGADAQTVEQSVATPIEQEMSGVDNMNYMYSLRPTTANSGSMSTSMCRRIQVSIRSWLRCAKVRRTPSCPRKSAITA